MSRETKYTDIAVTEILCDYPHVTVEKNKRNSRFQPRRVTSIVEFRLYSEIRLNCKSTNRFNVRWDAYQVFSVETSVAGLNATLEDADIDNEEEEFATLPSEAQKFSDPDIRFKKISGLQFTSKSEDIAIPRRFLPIGLYLICMNVAMDGVVGINTSDCIHVQIVLPPLVAAIEYGVRRTIGFGQIVDLNANSSSYDPNEGNTEMFNGKLNSSTFEFIWSCPYRINGEELLEEDFANYDDELSLIFDGKQGKIFSARFNNNILLQVVGGRLSKL